MIKKTVEVVNDDLSCTANSAIESRSTAPRKNVCLRCGKPGHPAALCRKGLFRELKAELVGLDSSKETLYDYILDYFKKCRKLNADYISLLPVNLRVLRLLRKLNNNKKFSHSKEAENCLNDIEKQLMAYEIELLTQDIKNGIVNKEYNFRNKHAYCWVHLEDGSPILRGDSIQLPSQVKANNSEEKKAKKEETRKMKEEAEALRVQREKERLEAEKKKKQEIERKEKEAKEKERLAEERRKKAERRLDAKEKRDQIRFEVEMERMQDFRNKNEMYRMKDAMEIEDLKERLEKEKKKIDVAQTQKKNEYHKEQVEKFKDAITNQEEMYETRWKGTARRGEGEKKSYKDQDPYSRSEFKKYKQQFFDLLSPKDGIVDRYRLAKLIKEMKQKGYNEFIKKQNPYILDYIRGYDV